ncbi:MAG: hypothetical protein GF334_05275 [Candidatus Altiarchaeales archaeon]|nr:hypothetical protein [Candidatus Altiarchaeales archaeon]
MILEGRRGLTGVGVLVIFIAVILVAALSATVMIGVSGGLQQKAIQRGERTEHEVSSGVEIVTVIASDGSRGNDLEHFEVYVRLQPGSLKLDLNDTVILADTADTTQALTLNGSVVDGTFPSTTRHFTVQYLKEGPSHDDGYLVKGDTAKLLFHHHDVAPGATRGGVKEHKKMRIQIIPRLGTVSEVYITTPHILIMERMTIWPAFS